MTHRFAHSVLTLAFWLAVPAIAEEGGAPSGMTPEQMAEMEAYMKAGAPGPEHKMLAGMAGTYDVAVKTWYDPSGPPEESKATATRSMDLEGRVLIERFEGSMMGTPFTGLGQTGFDNVSKEYWSTWMDSMSTGMMVSKGSCDEKHTCTFTGSWNDAIKKGPVSMRVQSRWTSPTTEHFEMYGPGKDGKEMKMMEMTYTKR
jgi:hypothetical protein